MRATSHVMASPFACGAWHRPSGCQLPLPAVELDDHARTLVDAIEVALLEVVDAVRADHFLAAEDRIAQRSAERRRPRLALAQRTRRGIDEHHVAVQRAGRERNGGRRAVAFLE